MSSPRSDRTSVCNEAWRREPAFASRQSSSTRRTSRRPRSTIRSSCTRRSRPGTALRLRCTRQRRRPQARTFSLRCSACPRERSRHHPISRLRLRRQALAVDSHVLAAASPREFRRSGEARLQSPDDVETVGHRPRTQQRVRLGATPDGKLVSLMHDSLYQRSILDRSTTRIAASPLASSTACPNLRVDRRPRHAQHRQR